MTTADRRTLNSVIAAMTTAVMKLGIDYDKVADKNIYYINDRIGAEQSWLEYRSTPPLAVYYRSKEDGYITGQYQFGGRFVVLCFDSKINPYPFEIHKASYPNKSYRVNRFVEHLSMYYDGFGKIDEKIAELHAY